VVLARRNGVGTAVEGAEGGRSQKRSVAGRGGVWKTGGEKSGR
jgi:hypothetical protein